MSCAVWFHLLVAAFFISELQVALPPVPAAKLWSILQKLLPCQTRRPTNPHGELSLLQSSGRDMSSSFPWMVWPGLALACTVTASQMQSWWSRGVGRPSRRLSHTQNFYRLEALQPSLETASSPTTKPPALAAATHCYGNIDRVLGSGAVRDFRIQSPTLCGEVPCG